MNNPLNGIYLYKIETRQPKTRDLVAIAYQGKTGIVRAYHGYGDRVLAKVGGFGYDKVSTALAEAIESLYGVNLDVNGASGETAVIEAAKAEGFIVRNMLSEAISL